jgi:Tol biopolymer transport system component
MAGRFLSCRVTTWFMSRSTIRISFGSRSTIRISFGLCLAALLCLSAANPEDARPAFPGSPGLIALQRSTDPDASAIWVLDSQTGDGRQLTFRGFNREPAFAPDGQWIAFVSDLPKSYFNIWVVRPDGAGMRRLTRGMGEVGAEAPAFSANGRWVAFSVEARGDRREIDRVASTGGHRQLLVPHWGKTSVYSPAYSPDGIHLAWVEYRESRRAVPQIIIGDSNGRGGRRVTRGNEPEFSPDGHSIVFCGNPAALSR